jgi:N-acetyl-alpha-D-glucosaminyl L-malate synthase BshA
LALASKIVEVAETAKLDVMHMHYAVPHATAAFLAREIYKPQRYLPFVTTLHGTDITLVGAHKSFLPVTKFSIEQSDAVTAISQYLAAETCRTFGYDDVEIIPNFINATHYYRRDNQALRQQLAPNNENLLMHVSNFRPVKRITDCVRAFARLRARCEQCVRLVMCGDGPEREKAQLLAEELGVAEDVIFAGSVPNIADYLSVADVFLLPSETESFGLAALEAMACEVPVIASHVGGLPEVVREGETGYLVPVGDIQAMADRAGELFDSESFRLAMGRRARAIAIDEFATERVIPQYIRLYERVVLEAGESKRFQIRTG